MALDEAVFHAVRSGESSPTVRFYSWETPGITIGHSQNARRVLDLDRCERDGIPVTRRLTGGRAVFHDNELTYSAAGPVDDPCFGGTLMDTYASISRGFLDALTALGVTVDWSRGGHGGDAAGVGQSPCFLSASRYEVTIGGRKLIGSAQRRIGGYFLQQGSVLTGPGHLRIADYLPDGVNPDEIRREIAKKTVDLSAVMPHSFDRSRLVTVFVSLFGQTGGVDLVPDEPSPRELTEAHRIMERYASKGWVTGDET